MQNHVRVMCPYKLHQFRRVNGRDLHVRPEFHPGQLRKVVDALTVFPARKGKVKTLRR